jgi:TRAP-type mannitol/chloroaromatic compound transport system permease small subunit
MERLDGREALPRRTRAVTLLLRFSRLVDAVSRLIGMAVTWLVLAAVLVSAGNATIRKAFDMSSNAWLELQWYMFGAIVLLGASYTLKMNEHVRVDVLYSAASERARIWIDIVGFVVFFLPVTFFLTGLTWPFFWRSFQIGEMSNNAGGLILWPVKLVLPAGFLLLTLQGLSELIKRIAALQGLIRLETRYEKPLQ